MKVDTQDLIKIGCFAAVAVADTVFHFDQAYDYVVPPELHEQVRSGSLVQVSFGKGTNLRFGLVLERHNVTPDGVVKPISAVVSDAPRLPEDLTKLLPWLKERCFCTLFEAYRAMMPTGLQRRNVVSFALANVEQTSASATEQELCWEELEVLTVLRTQKRFAFSEKETLLKKCRLPTDSKILEKMVEKGFLVQNIDVLKERRGMVDRVFRVVESLDFDGLSAKQREAVQLLQESGPATMREFCEMGGSLTALKNLQKKEIIVTEERELFRVAAQNREKLEIELTAEQQRAFENLKTARGIALLFGVTGSGKTQVYLRLIDEFLEKGKSALVLVPEISLTPALFQKFTERYGEIVEIVHSSRSVGERVEAWKRIRAGRARVVLGTRSAVFAPLPDIGIIVVDEEHEHSYKSEQSPRYHAREVAKARAAQHGALLLLASATPSVETYARARQGLYKLENLTSRYGAAQLPEVRTVDLPEEGVLLSLELLEHLRRTISEGHQAILLIHRRGYQAVMTCKSCKAVVHCPHCSISLIWHLDQDCLRCHYCGFRTDLPQMCPECEGDVFRFRGAGTQRLVVELQERLPEARVLRMDSDAAARKHAREQILTEFETRNYDILVGTQMVAKGLDFENVTLVGVVSIDHLLFFDDYRSLERSFALLTQVVGRAGRGRHPGVAIVQTLNPNNDIIRLAERQNFPEFFETELPMRRLMTYPPYCALCMLVTVGSDEPLVKAGAQFLSQRLQSHAEENSGNKIIILGPTAARVGRVNGQFRWRLLVKCTDNALVRKMFAEVLIEIGKDRRFSGIYAHADLYPETIL